MNGAYITQNFKFPWNYSTLSFLRDRECTFEAPLKKTGEFYKSEGRENMNIAYLVWNYACVAKFEDGF